MNSQSMVEMVSAVKSAHPTTGQVQTLPGTSFGLGSRITYLNVNLFYNVNNKMSSYVTRVINRKWK